MDMWDTLKKGRSSRGFWLTAARIRQLIYCNETITTLTDEAEIMSVIYVE